MSNTIIRAPRRHRFLIIDQRAVEDSRLSWAARGLLAYLLSRPDDWKVLVNDLRKRGDLGRDGIYGLLKQLRSAGYLRFVRSRDEHGRIRGGSYIVQEIAASPVPDLPDLDEPFPAAPSPANPGALPSTEVNLRNTTTTTPTHTKESRSSSGLHFRNLRFADWVPVDLREQAVEKVARLESSIAQIVIDEWTGIMATDRIETSPLGYLHAMVSRFEEGEFRLHYADQVAEIRTQDDVARRSNRAR